MMVMQPFTALASTTVKIVAFVFLCFGDYQTSAVFYTFGCFLGSIKINGLRV